MLDAQGIHIVATERGPTGGRLVLIDENGDRLGDLTRFPAGGAAGRDNSPAWSPDGRWIVFASSRDRAGPDKTSLWIIAARSDEQPRRLTGDDAVDLSPAWTPDGTAVVFSSSRGGSIHLWRQDLRAGADGWPEAAGPPVPLTRGDTHDFYPSIDPTDPTGERIVFMRLSRDRDRSTLWLWSAGTETELTAGPADVTPAWSPDGRTIAFAAPSLAGDIDLHAMDADGGNRRVLVIEPESDQSGPVWSGDGRYLFATSAYRSTVTGRPLLSLITFVDLIETPLILRALQDSSVVESRTGPALSRAELDAAALHRNPGFHDALKRAQETLLREVDREVGREMDRKGDRHGDDGL